MIRQRNIDPGSTIGQETLAFPIVASIGASVANSTKQSRLTVPYKCRIVKISTYSDTRGAQAAGTHTVDVFQDGGSPATVLASALAHDAADTYYEKAAANTTTEYAAGQKFSVRAVTPASGSLTNLQVQLTVVKVD